MSLIANSFPELAFLVMREVKDQRFFRLRDLVARAKDLAIELRIDSRYEPFSADWVEQLNGCMKRESGANNTNNEERFCVFSPESRSCTEPWGLTTEPREGESYSEYRRRNRGHGSVKRSASSEAKAAAFLATPPTLVQVKAEPLYVVTPEEGDGRHYICIFENAIEYRNADNVTHREGDDYELPAFIDWGGGTPCMKFCKNGRDHRLDGPAHLFPNKEENVYVIANEDCGEAGHESALKMFQGLYRRHTGQSMDYTALERLMIGAYRDFEFFADEMADAKRLYASYVGAEAEAAGG